LLRVVTLNPEDAGIMDVRAVDILPHQYTVSQPRKPRLESFEVTDRHLTKTLKDLIPRLLLTPVDTAVLPSNGLTAKQIKID